MYYKYRAFNSRYSEELFSKNSIYFAGSKDLNDPFELSPFFKPPKDVHERIAFADYMLIKHFPHLKRKERIRQRGQFVKELLDKDFLRDTMKITYEDTIGIYSSTKIKDNLLMWSYYAEAHSGFCVGYDLDSLPGNVFKAPHPVDYSDTYPVITTNEWMSEVEEVLIEGFKKIALVKSNSWLHEQEIRFIRNLSEGGIGPYLLKTGTMKEVILGAKISDDNRELILNWISKYQAHVKIFNAKLHESSYELVFEELN